MEIYIYLLATIIILLLIIAYLTGAIQCYRLSTKELEHRAITAESDCDAEAHRANELQKELVKLKDKYSRKNQKRIKGKFA